jgi:hypothetical protein
MSINKNKFRFKELSRDWTNQELTEHCRIGQEWTRLNRERFLENEGNDAAREWSQFWSSDEFQTIMRQYYECVPYEEHIEAVLEMYHEYEIQVWEEADQRFPNTRRNMRREFYFKPDAHETIEREDANDEEKAWHHFVDLRLEKVRYWFEKMVPEPLRQSYVPDFI